MRENLFFGSIECCFEFWITDEDNVAVAKLQGENSVVLQETRKNT
jgi:hypothetical protein